MTGPDHDDGLPGLGRWRRVPPSELGVADTWSVWFVHETGSTNADLLAAGDAPHRTVLAAGHQTSGRGRLDRRWEAPPGANLLVSLLLRGDAEALADTTRRVGIAAVEAVASVADVGATLKWPNDVLLGDRKLAGILAQRAAPDSLVVGLGLNVGWAPAGAALLGPDANPLTVLAALLNAFDALPDDVHDRYVELLDTIGRRVRVEIPNGELIGTAVGVDRDGRLDVLDACAISHRIDAGDVVHLRSADG